MRSVQDGQGWVHGHGFRRASHESRVSSLESYPASAEPMAGDNSRLVTRDSRLGLATRDPLHPAPVCRLTPLSDCQIRYRLLAYMHRMWNNRNSFAALALPREGVRSLP